MTRVVVSFLTAGMTYLICCGVLWFFDGDPDEFIQQ